MAAKKIKDQAQIPKHYCRDCALAYDYHEMNVKGEFFMCRCPFHKFSRFLNHDTCNDHFKPKTT